MAEQGLWVMPKRTVLAVALHGIKRISLEIFVISVSSSVTSCLQGTCFWIMLSLSHGHFSWSVESFGCLFKNCVSILKYFHLFLFYV